MFTGLVEKVVKLARIEALPPGMRLYLDDPQLAQEAVLGESIALNGCCLTVVHLSEGQLAFDAGPETLARTNLGRLRAGDGVNVERSLRLGERLGGHLVMGHVDGQGRLDARSDAGDWSVFWFQVSRALARQMASKGSVAVDGVSLTLVDVEAERFSVALIPHTLAVTTLGKMRVGDHANIETDVLAKYVERQLAVRAGE